MENQWILLHYLHILDSRNIQAKLVLQPGPPHSSGLGQTVSSSKRPPLEPYSFCVFKGTSQNWYPGPQIGTLIGIEVFVVVIMFKNLKVISSWTGVVLNPVTGVPIRERKEEKAERHWVKGMWWWSQRLEWCISKSGKPEPSAARKGQGMRSLLGTLGGTDPADTLMLNFWPPKLRETKSSVALKPLLHWFLWWWFSR